MLRNHDSKTILVLEGDTDGVTLSECLDRDECRTVIAHGKTDVIDAVEWADQQGYVGVLAIVDSDFVDIEEVRSESRNIVYTDAYDLDAMVFFAAGILERCIESLCMHHTAHGSTYDPGECAKVRDTAIGMAGFIGAMRLYSIRGGHHIAMDDFPFESAYKGSPPSLDSVQFAKIMLGRLKGADEAESLLNRWISLASVEPLPERRRAQGHDLFRSLALVVRKRWGASFRGDIWERFARSHWKMLHLEGTEMHAEVEKWCKRNNRKVWVSAA
ncbi:hypothetical protein [Streptomyces omiyaensis]|uniref:DUF4435 domain-containing protein n=1 Tax=Streptomyces omiyaensis TaxID=68247 RepID=A0ABW7BWS4_9ACTN